MSDESLPPVMLLRSFLTIGSGYALSLMSFFAVVAILGYSFFPQFVEFAELDQQTRETIMENNPETAIPRAMFWSIVVANSVACLGIGWLTIRTAPFAPFPHAIFLAVLIFISYLQIAIADPPAKKSMTLAYMIAFPIATIIGAKWAVGRGTVEPGVDPDSDV